MPNYRAKEGCRGAANSRAAHRVLTTCDPSAGTLGQRALPVL